MITRKNNYVYSLQNKNDGTSYRIFEIDLIRGIAILLVIIDHFFFEVMYFGNEWFKSAIFCSSPLSGMYFLGAAYWTSPLREWVRWIVIGIFFLVSGISSSFSRDNYKRGMRMFLFALALNLATYSLYLLNIVDFRIDFNAIHVFAISTLFYALINKLDNKSKFTIVFALTVLYIWITYEQFEVNHYFFLPIGIYPDNYVRMDYMSLLPWIQIFIIGGMIGKEYYYDRKSLFKDKKRDNAFDKVFLFMGRNSLYFYLGHQLVWFLLFMVFGLIMGFY